jgi:hypothetical protein
VSVSVQVLRVVIPALIGVLATGAAPAAPRATKPPAPPEQASKEPFGRIPKGPLQLIISFDQQRLHLFSDGVHVADAPVATGVAQHPTPFGIFSIIQKSRYHRSNIYSDAPMPYMQRITWSGIAIHEGVGVGHPASHGCIRVPHDFAARLWTLTRLGARVVIARPELRPQAFADPHLFVHRDQQPTPSPPPAEVDAKPLQTAQTVNDSKTTDMPDDAKNSDAPAAAAVPGADAPAPPAKPAVHAIANMPIAIFISGREKKLYVRQDFAPLFDAPIVIAQPEQRLGTYVFTALDYLDDHSTLRWNVIALPGERAAPHAPQREKTPAGAKHGAQRAADPPPPETPKQALARIEIPQETIDQISQLIVPGSSLIISDQGLGEETGEGTDFVVVTR